MVFFQPTFLCAIEPGIIQPPIFRHKKGGKRHVERGQLVFGNGWFWGDGELPSNQERGEIFPALGFRDGNALDRLSVHSVVAVRDPRGDLWEFELLSDKIDLNVIVDVVRRVGLLATFGLELGIPDLAVRIGHTHEKILKRGEQVPRDILEGLGIGDLQEGECVFVLPLGLVFVVM